MSAQTVPPLLRDASLKNGDRFALRQPSGKQVSTWTWKQYLEAAEEIAAGLRSLGISNGDHVAICSETTAEFYLTDQGILMNGSVIGSECLIAAGALVPEGANIPPRSLVVGVPAKVIRELTDDEVAGLRRNARVYTVHRDRHRDATDAASAR